eukprot:TRINITY_DN10839_c0_g1_i1.p1 TRINITY_DN10839_c0_g1~~TRINITY_DN10839_c0_g1_i1.p1  ORF type:complete len:196 (-),score=31.33 TRINITY_DN10839_c0_g1_i1:71-658(-)
MEISIRSDMAGDAFYRYKMPPLKIKRQGKSTLLQNIDHVAKSLNRPPEQIMKFFGFSLSAPIRSNGETNDYAIKGTFDLDTLNGLIHEFIEKFILCRACGNPETVVRVRGGKVMLKCDACNSTTEANNKHKLAAYIIKHKASTKSKYASITGKQIDEGALTDVKTSDFDDDSSWAIDTSSDAVAKRRLDALESGK